MNTKPTYFSKILNSILVSLSIFTIFYIWSVYATKNISLSIFISSIISIVLITIYLYNSRKNLIKYKLNRNKEKQLEYIKTQLLLGYDIDIISYYKEIFKSYINTSNIFYNDKECIALLYDKESIDTADILPIYKKYKDYNISILCIEFTSSLEKFISKNQLDITILDIVKSDSIYFQKYGYPDFKISIEKRINYKDILKNILSKKRAKGYFVSSIFILLYTIYLPYKTMYLVLSTILLLLSISSIFLDKKST